MNRAEIIERVSNATGLTRAEVAVVFEGVLKSIESELAKGGTVELRRFGTFKCVRRGKLSTPAPESRSRSKRRLCLCSRLPQNCVTQLKAQSFRN